MPPIWLVLALVAWTSQQSRAGEASPRAGEASLEASTRADEVGLCSYTIAPTGSKVRAQMAHVLARTTWVTGFHDCATRVEQEFGPDFVAWKDFGSWWDLFGNSVSLLQPVYQGQLLYELEEKGSKERARLAALTLLESVTHQHGRATAVEKKIAQEWPDLFSIPVHQYEAWWNGAGHLSTF